MKKSLPIVLIALVWAAAAARAEVALPDVFGDSMVLQQKSKVPVWGTAAAGETVVVSFEKQKLTVVADANGRWRVDLKPLRASFTPQALTVEGRNRIVISNVLVGEVWLVAGQSNMQWTLAQSAGGESAAAAADHPNLRLFNVSREVAFGRRPGKIGEWKVCRPESVRDFSGAGYFFGVELQKALNVPVGLINSSYGGSQAEAWTPVEYLTNDPELRATVERAKIWDAERPRVKVEYAAAIEEWKKKSEEQKAAGVRPSPSPPVPDALRDYRPAASIYDRMIAPLLPFAMRGAAWYQGESNEARAEQYGILLPTMIRAWREKWGQGNFPFGIIQLPNYRAAKPEPEDAPWSFLRDAQRRTAQRVAETGLIVTIDIGEAGDIHPKNKLDVGKRMAVWALRDVYGRKITDAPRLKKTATKNGKIILTFENVGAGLRIGGGGERLEEFAIAGADRKFVWAEARIVGKKRVEVFSPLVPAPFAVRYAFNSNPKNPNLTNDSGLPAAPFRTDDFPDPTAGRR